MAKDTKLSVCKRHAVYSQWIRHILRTTLSTLHDFKMSELKFSIGKPNAIAIGRSRLQGRNLCSDTRLIWEDANFEVLGIQLNSSLQNREFAPEPHTVLQTAWSLVNECPPERCTGMCVGRSVFGVCWMQGQ